MRRGVVLTRGVQVLNVNHDVKEMSKLDRSTSEEAPLYLLKIPLYYYYHY